MPSGRAHEAINLSLLGGGALIYLAYGGSPEEPKALTFALAYLAGTFLLSPDLDLSEKGVRAQRRWGVLGVLWRPYGWLFRHRGLSHTWFLGPLTRLGYLTALVLLGSSLAQGLASSLGVDLNLRPPPWPPEALAWGLAGYYLSQWFHLVADGIWPDHDLRRLKRPR